MFHWFIQKQLSNEEGYDDIIRTMNVFNIPHTIISSLQNIDNCFCIEKPIMILGSYSLIRLGQLNKWKPGSFMNDNHTYLKWIENYGNAMLNYDAIIKPLNDIVIHNPSFLRPVEDTKSFSGTIFQTNNDFVLWKNQKILQNKDILNLNTNVVLSPLKTIYKEMRFFIVDKTIISASIYKQNGQNFISNIIDEDARNFTKSQIQKWQPARAFVIDIAQTDNGFKIVEINCINCSGFYACDAQSIVMAIEQMELF